MRQVRRGVFETNSSSSHSIVVTKQDLYYTAEEIKENLWLWDGVLKFYEHDLSFGRSPFEPLVSFRDKLRYAFASYSYDEYKIEEIKNIVFSLVPECLEIKFPSNDWNEDDEGKMYYGDVDHDSCGLLDKCLQKENIDIKEFLTNKQYKVMIDGDEYNEWEKLKECGLVKTEDIRIEYHPY